MNEIIIFIIIIIIIIYIFINSILIFCNFDNHSIKNIVKSIMNKENYYFRSISKYEKDILKKKTDILDIQLKKYPKIKQIEWKFRIITVNIKYYFTYGSYIYIPYNKINKISLNTLLHEKIHILQRIYTNKFNEYYIKKLNYIHNLPIKLSTKWKNLHLINPDSLDINWVFKENGNYYLPLLLKNFKKVVVLLKKKDNIFITTNFFYNFIKFNFFSKYLQFYNSLYHPNELLANLITDFVLKNKTDTDLEMFLKKL